MNRNRTKSLVSDAGFIVTEVSYSHIASEFTEIIRTTIDRTAAVLGPQLHSIYIYGSVAAGRAVLGKSDLDVLVVLNEEPGEATASQIYEAAEELSSMFEKEVREVGMAYTWSGAVQDGDESLGLKVFLKHLCLCFLGEDLRKEIEDFRPVKEVAAALNGDAPYVMSRLWKSYNESRSAKDKMSIRATIARKIIRTGSSLATARKGVWATERSQMAQLFIDSYPHKRRQVETAILAADESLSVSEGQLETLKMLSEWTVQEASCELRIQT